MTAPVANFRADDLLDPERFRNGPLAVFWGQGEIVECNRALPDPPIPSRSPLDRLARRRPWRIDVRLVPPADQELGAWITRIAALLALPVAPPEDDDKALWLVASGNYRTPSHALGAMGQVFNGPLRGERISGAQVIVSAMEGV